MARKKIKRAQMVFNPQHTPEKNSANLGPILKYERRRLKKNFQRISRMNKAWNCGEVFEDLLDNKTFPYQTRSYPVFYGRIHFRRFYEPFLTRVFPEGVKLTVCRWSESRPIAEAGKIRVNLPARILKPFVSKLPKEKPRSFWQILETPSTHPPNNSIAEIVRGIVPSNTQENSGKLPSLESPSSQSPIKRHCPRRPQVNLRAISEKLFRRLL